MEGQVRRTHGKYFARTETKTRCTVSLFLEINWAFRSWCTHGYKSSYAKLVLLDLALYYVPVQSTVSLFWFWKPWCVAMCTYSDNLDASCASVLLISRELCLWWSSFFTLRRKNGIWRVCVSVYGIIAPKQMDRL